MAWLQFDYGGSLGRLVGKEPDIRPGVVLVTLRQADDLDQLKSDLGRLDTSVEVVEFRRWGKNYLIAQLVDYEEWRTKMSQYFQASDAADPEATELRNELMAKRLEVLTLGEAVAQMPYVVDVELVDRKFDYFVPEFSIEVVDSQVDRYKALLMDEFPELRIRAEGMRGYTAVVSVPVGRERHWWRRLAALEYVTHAGPEPVVKIGNEVD
jgi:hypothetical protein